MSLLLIGGFFLFLAVTALPYVLTLTYYAYTQPEESPINKDHDHTPTVSIVLPTYNEEDIIKAKLDDIKQINYPTDKLELIIVDSGDDNTVENIKEYLSNQTGDNPYPHTLIEEFDERGLAPALNHGYAHAGNELILKTDCDSKIGADSLREATANFTDQDVGVVTGQQTDVLGGSEVEAGYRSIQALIQTLESWIDSTLICHGPFTLFRNDCFTEQTRIDTDSIADDTELALKIRTRLNKRVIFDPAVEYAEASHSQFGKRRQQKDRRAMGLIRLLTRQRTHLFNHDNYGKVVLPMNWSFMIFSPILMVIDFVLLGAATMQIGGIPAVTLAVLAVYWFMKLGENDKLGPLQPAYSLFDTQVSLLSAMVGLITGTEDGTWDVDDELREKFAESDD